MAFRTFDRKVYFALESTEGTYLEPNNSAGYIETTEPTWTITNRQFDRNPTRGSITPVPMQTPGTSKTAPSATIEISFSVEMAGSGTAATAPRWGSLLKACGMEAADGLNDAGSADAQRALYRSAIGNLAGTNAPYTMFHKENIGANGSDTTYGTSTRSGRVIGDTGYDDGELFYIKAGASNVPQDTEPICGATSLARGVQSGTTAASGCAWFPTSDERLGGGAYSSLTMEFVVNSQTASTGTAISAVGCRGNVEFVFVAGDRVLMNFTFTGRLHGYTEGLTFTPVAEGRPIPPSFDGVDMTIQDSSYGATSAAAVSGLIFNALTINMGNEVTVRENVEVASGYSAAYITGRTPTMTWNPDAVLAGTYDFWERFLVGETSRTKLNVGTTAGNKFQFKMPAVQFTGLTDGNRDEVTVYDTTSTLTGGDYGSSIQEDFDNTGTAAGAATNKRLGTNNEFVLYQL
tara:strand:- start:919 stop:2304 length:1386 start_codon:yes stop_codon:yes gene_type:complete